MKMNKNTSKRIFKILSVTLASLLLSCNGLIDSTDESVSATAEKSVVRLSIQETAARTAYPEIKAADFTKISLYGKNLYFAPMNKEWVAKLDAETAERVYRERFSNPADFTFVFVGDFSGKH